MEDLVEDGLTGVGCVVTMLVKSCLLFKYVYMYDMVGCRDRHEQSVRVIADRRRDMGRC